MPQLPTLDSHQVIVLLILCTQGMDRVGTVVGSAGVEHPGNSSGRGEPTGGAGPSATTETSPGDRNLPRPEGTLLAVLRLVLNLSIQ